MNYLYVIMINNLSDADKAEILTVSDLPMDRIIAQIEKAIKKYYPPGWMYDEVFTCWNDWEIMNNHASRQTAKNKRGEYFRYTIDPHDMNYFDLLHLSP